MANPIQFYNRYTQAIESESIYGESYLRWTYESPFGRLALWLLVKRSLFSAWYGWRMDRLTSRNKVEPFIEKYRIAMDDYRQGPEGYRTFNEFFYRELGPGARPIAGNEDVVALPADGRHLAIPDLSKVERIYAKGQSFDLPGLLGSAEQAERFTGGSMVISRLCPVDYHRFHSPVEGRLTQIERIPGPLYSVSPVALRNRMSYLWRNKRAMALIETRNLGMVAFVPIGATCVGRIHMTVHEGCRLSKGSELGYFAFGGSCVAT
ncbi:MAG: archaetidylserine decarboxylase, partial [Opitutales bacterium]|nr:archaetidylserine decarboxylase [Opitutales bacterium]